MAKHILAVTDREVELEEIVATNADKVLEQIDLDALLADPSTYLNDLAQAFLSDHMDEIEEGAKAGKAFAEKVLLNS